MPASRTGLSGVANTASICGITRADALRRVMARAPYLDITRYDVAAYYAECDRGLPRILLWSGIALTVLTAHVALVAAAMPDQKATPTVNQPPPQAVLIDLEPFSASVAADKAQEARAFKKDSSKIAKFITAEEQKNDRAANGKALEIPLDPLQKAMLKSEASSTHPSKNAKNKGTGLQSPTAQKKGRLTPAKSRMVSPPKLMAEASPRAAEQSPQQGSAGQPANIPSSWRNALYAHLNRFKHYPQDAKDEHRQGTALLSFTLDRDGKVLDFFLVRSSGDSSLDKEVLAMIERASPLPIPPPEVEEPNLHLVVPIQFSLR